MACFTVTIIVTCTLIMAITLYSVRKHQIKKKINRRPARSNMRRWAHNDGETKKNQIKFVLEKFPQNVRISREI
jgi:hypothetical protein